VKTSNLTTIFVFHSGLSDIQINCDRISEVNGIRVVNFATSKYLTVKLHNQSSLMYILPVKDMVDETCRMHGKK
jgi:hypothetical protein